MKDLLLIGGSGFLGRKLIQELGRQRVLSTYFKNKSEDGVYFDFADPNLQNIVSQHQNLKYAIISGGVIDFGRIRENPSFARYINVDCVEKIISELATLGITPIFISSESVFDGTKGNYTEADIPNPQIEYAKQKVEVENYLIENVNNYMILRSSKIFSSELTDNTLISDWIRKLSNNETIHCANDNIFSPIHVEDLCKMIVSLIKQNSRGVFHLCSQKALNRKEMLDLVLQGYTARRVFSGTIEYRSLHDFKGAEKQPLDTSMIPQKAISETKVIPRNFDYWARFLTQSL
jgi:dTDP-4-dehydrorhamnose reductase